MWTLFYKKQTGKYPWDDKESIFGRIPLTDEQFKTIEEKAPWMKSILYIKGKRADFNMGFFNPNMERAGRALGINAMYDSKMQGADMGQSMEAVKKDQLNSFLTPLVSAPSIKMAATMIFGRSPYFTSLRDFNSGDQSLELAKTVRTMNNAVKQQGANVAQGLMDVNPLISMIAENQGFSFKPKYQEEDKEAIKTLSIVTNIMFPRLFKAHIDNNKMAVFYAKQRKQIERESLREQGIKSVKKSRTRRSENDGIEKPERIEKE